MHAPSVIQTNDKRSFAQTGAYGTRGLLPTSRWPDLGFCCFGRWRGVPCQTGKRFLRARGRGLASDFATRAPVGRRDLCLARTPQLKSRGGKMTYSTTRTHLRGLTVLIAGRHGRLMSVGQSSGTSHLWVDLRAGHRQLGSGDRQRDRYGQRTSRRAQLGPGGDHELGWRVLGRAPDPRRL